MSEKKAAQFGAQPNQTLSKLSLYLGIGSSVLVFGVGFCTIVNASIGLLQVVGIPALICGGMAAFPGLIALLLGAAGALTEKSGRSIAIAGAITGLLGLCMFVLFLQVGG